MQNVRCADNAADATYSNDAAGDDVRGNDAIW